MNRLFAFVRAGTVVATLILTSMLVATSCTSEQTSSAQNKAPEEKSAQNQHVQRSLAERCAGKRVLVCEGFESMEKFMPAQWPASGLYPGSCPTCTFRDTEVKASGKSSLRMDLIGKGGPRPAGNWAQHFGKAFGPGSTFYVSYSFRVDKNWLVDWDVLLGSWPKLSIIHNWAGGTCAMEEITVSDLRGSRAPTMYGECGGTSFTTNLDGVTPNPKTNPPYLIQQGKRDPSPTTGYECHNYDPKPGPPYTGHCFYFEADVWYTLYWKIHVGDWSKPNSSVEGYIGPSDGQLKKFINALKWTLNSNNPPDNGFDAITLTQFMTNAKLVTHPTAYVWYDDLIVSPEPIPPPSGVTPASQVP